MREIEKQAARLYLNHHPVVLNVAFRAAPLPGMAEDIAQDVFMEFVTHADRWDLTRDVEPLLVRITQNVALRYWQERKKNFPPKLMEIARELQKEMETDACADGREKSICALTLCLEKLSPQSRRTVDLYYRDSLDMRQIGDAMKISPNAARLSMFRIRNTLRACIERILREDLDDE